MRRSSVAFAGLLLLTHGCASEDSEPDRRPSAASPRPTATATALGPGMYSMTTHTGVTVTAKVPAKVTDARVADLERLRAAVDAPQSTYAVVGLDNRAGEHVVDATHLTIKTTQGEAVRLLPVAAQGPEPGLLSVLVRRGADPRDVNRMRKQLAGDERVAIGRRSEAVYATLGPLPVEEIAEVALPIEEDGPEYALFKVE